MSPILSTRSQRHWPRQVAVACALAASLGAVAQPAAKTTTNTPTTDAEVRPGERLSTWLLRQPEGTAAPGLAWRVPQERLAQQFLKNTLLVRIEAANRLAPRADQVERLKLITWLQGMPITGRVALGVVDPRWLQAHPEEDPILSAGQQLVAPPPDLKTVAVVRPGGELCNVAHEPGRSAWDYVTACGTADSRDWAWIAQPDGRTARVGVAPWNSQPSDEPAPGAWIWAAPRDMSDLVAASEGIIKFLATQGPAPQGLDAADASAAFAPLEAPAPTRSTPPSTTVSVRPEPVPQYQAYRSSGNDWGETGLLQTPSARMGQAGDFRASLTNVAPYSRLNFMFQPLDWLEAGFRYTSISNRVYAASTTGQSNKDKSIDLKVRLLSESAYVPEMALGFRDLGGTGLFSSEYLVANKRYGDLDFSLGIGWGYMGSSGNIRNPLLALSNRFRTRSGSSATGGEVSFGSFFRGPAAMFGGVAWRTPWEPLTVKLEYDGNDYQHEPQNNNLPQRTPFNIGLEYRYSKNVAFTAGFERGNRAMIGITLSTSLASLNAPKAADPPQPRFTPNTPANPPGWASTAEEIQSRTEWTVQRIAPQGSNLHVWVTESNTVYREARVQQIIAVLHRDAPASATTFILHYNERGLAMHAQVVERAEWVAAHYQAQTPAERRTVSQRDYAPPQDNSEDRLIELPSKNAASTNAAGALQPADAAMTTWEHRPEKFIFGLTPSFSQILGGPDAFALYQLGVAATAEYRFNKSTWVNGALNWRLLDNFDKFTYTAPSNLPRVRTFQREYVTTKRLTMPVLQITHVGRLSDDQYYSVYGGALEPMFAGFGGEWLYRPWRSKFALGIDINHVQQRDFAQNFKLRDYKVNTGHATLYWDTGWNGVRARISVGQYLAGDRGASIDISRTFDNGVTIGAYATKTNVSATQFGEGSFDKGIFISVPFDALLPRSSKFSANFTWAPLVRDGGAKLGRINPLYEMTTARDPAAFSFSAPDDNKPKAGDNILNFGPAQ
ncbi:YjbH domain-containing protein [Variovorax sp. RB3P1]|uniref:YjbH domain-containing protein n=1 Tax=Variovorax sp. RB3P1 TaxID=3443732 RepID=UPI003F45FB96